MNKLLSIWDISKCVSLKHGELADFLLMLSQERNIYKVKVEKGCHCDWFVSKL